MHTILYAGQKVANKNKSTAGAVQVEEIFAVTLFDRKCQKTCERLPCISALALTVSVMLNFKKVELQTVGQSYRVQFLQ